MFDRFEYSAECHLNYFLCRLCGEKRRPHLHGNAHGRSRIDKSADPKRTLRGFVVRWDFSELLEQHVDLTRRFLVLLGKLYSLVDQTHVVLHGQVWTREFHRLCDGLGNGHAVLSVVNLPRFLLFRI